MSGRRRVLVGVLVLAAAGVLPAMAVSETTPTIEAFEGPGYYGLPHSWNPAAATVTAGGAVTFSNTTGNLHGLRWTLTSGQPTPTCSSGVPVDNWSQSWQGQCVFSQPGSYTFVCTVHPEMTGTITVNPNGTTTTTTTTTPLPGGGSSPPPPTTNPASGSPSPAGSPLTALSVPSRQRGKAVHGSLVVSQAGAGGRLEVALLARGASLAKVRRPPQVRVGRLVRASLSPGKVSFTVPLSAKAKHALKLRRRIALTVAIVLTPAQGSAVTVTRSVLVTS
jgi:plastocyanin